MDMSSMGNDRLEMNIMWAIMGIMFIGDAFMIYIHMKLHKKVQILEKELSDRK